ncbi:MAG: SDR family oxidoreductase [Hyphomonadaceae bacterium]|nr:SDR family oxidoreductase [Hyphomonadaceae bacterium]MBC6411756.1 SDR family oxidoreductase [Hyphomonadaceae bacterium]
MSKAALITGGSVRIGEVITRGLARDGYNIAVHYNRSAVRADALVEELSETGIRAVAVHANLGVPQDLDTLVLRACMQLGEPVTVLINNASTFSPDAATDFTRGTFDHHMNVNLYAGIRLARCMAQNLPDDMHGNIINMIDQLVLKPGPDYFTYSLSKAGLFWATKTLAQSLAPRIRVNAVGPGPTLKNLHQTDREFDAEKSSTLLGLGSPPDGLLQAVLYLLSAESVTGQMIAVDGGQHLGY